ncbi:carboxypeptidase-like regulatory domain-containing protein [Winogradskyella pulchriflava]|uniref:Carboxypeptidase-like regulatory domain-containing protein n=1 Tax=Winogradskyella pulchriflava TaxID=1110688 RepID=A0ABV6QBH8_9FLAO
MKFLLLFIPFLIFPQARIAEGFALDKVTKKPIPYVNISIIDSQIGTSSNEDGSYSLQIKKEDLNKTVKLSSLGYKDTMFVVKSLLKLKALFLQSKVEQLDEVVISEKFEEEFLEINPIKKNEIVGGIGGMREHPYIFALYIPFDSLFSKTEYINKAKILLNKTSPLGGSQSMSSKFRFRMFAVGKDSLPENDLISKNIIVETTKKQRQVDIDLSELNLVFPREGVYVAIEWLYITTNAYKFSYTKKKSRKKYVETRYAPRISWIKRKGTTNNLAVYSSGTWYAMPIPSSKKNEYIVPAITLTLSN